MPINAIANKYSAIVSNVFPTISFSDLIAKKESKADPIRKNAIKVVNSSIILLSEKLEI